MTCFKNPFKGSLFTRCPYLQRFRAAHTRSSPILMNGGILKSPKLLAELAIKLYISNQQQHLTKHAYDCACASAGVASGFYGKSAIGSHLEGGTIPPYCMLQFLLFISIGSNRLCISIVFVKTWNGTFFKISSFICHRRKKVMQVFNDIRGSTFLNGLSH